MLVRVNYCCFSYLSRVIMRWSEQKILPCILLKVKCIILLKTWKDRWDECLTLFPFVITWFTFFFSWVLWTFSLYEGVWWSLITELYNILLLTVIYIRIWIIKATRIPACRCSDSLASLQDLSIAHWCYTRRT